MRSNLNYNDVTTEKPFQAALKIRSDIEKRHDELIKKGDMRQAIIIRNLLGRLWSL